MRMGGEGAGDAIPLLVIGGPTAAGKTELSLRVAERVGGEIISADSMQIYRRMDIGTAKPTSEERARAPIHLIDFVSPEGEYTVAQFKSDAQRCISEAHERGMLPILSGGTGLYLRAVTEGFDFPPPPGDDDVRERLWARVEEVGSEQMHELLSELDPEAAERIDRGDARRIVRALEVYELTGRPISEQQHVDAGASIVYNCARFVLTVPREALFDRIDRRVDLMMQDGWLEEVRDLASSGIPPDAQSMQAIGYRHLVEHLNDRLDLDEVIRVIKRDTRRYAKRQMTWLRSGSDYRWMAAGSALQRRACVETILIEARRLRG